MANNVNLAFPSAYYQQFIDKNGKPIAGGKLYTYIAGSSTPVVTYKTISGGTKSANRNTNPIILDMVGMAKLVISNDTAYKFILFDRNNVKIDEWDNVTAGGSEGGGSSNVYVEGTNGEIDVQEESTGLIRRFIVSLSDSVKNSISELYSSVNDIVNALYNKKDKQQPVNKQGSATKVPVSFSQNANGEMDVEFEDIAFPDWTTAINDAVANCEKTSNKKNSVTGYESSTTAYPSIKAVVDFVNSIMQNLGGKLITDNGNPFSDSADLPSTTPYQGVNISDKDYAYVQGTGFAERWSASVSGSDVTWVQEYSINIPVFTPAQQAAIDSGATSTKINNYELHINNTAIHVTSSEKNAWNAKQNAIRDLAGIRSGAAAGASALQPNGNGSNVTSTFTAASSRTNISSGEKLSIIFGKIAKWFSDLKALAFKDKVSDSDISGTISDAHIASASTWNAKQNAISDLAEIRSGAEAGAAAVQPEDLAAVATSGSYNDLSDKPTIPIVNNGNLTIYRNGTALGSFSANQSSHLGIDISVPTKTSDLVNDSFAAVATSGSYNDLSNKPSIPSAANNGMLIIRQNGTRKGTFSANQSSDVVIDLTNTTYSSLTPEPKDSSAGLCTRGEKFTWGTTGSQLQCARATKTGRYIDIGRLHSIGWEADVEGVAHFTIVGKLSTWANENNSVQFRSDVCVEFRHKPNSYPFETSRIYGRILYKGNSSQLSSISVVTRTEYHIDTATHYDLVIALSIPNASNNYTRIAVESFYAMNDYVGQVDGISMSYDRNITIYDKEPTGQHIDPNNSYELPTL